MQRRRNDSPRRRTEPLRRALAAVAMVAACGACGRDATGPGQSLAVTVRVVQLRGPVLGTSQTGQPTIECGIDLQATGTGTGRAVWGEAVFRFFIGTDRSAPFDSVVVTALDVQQSWNHSDIGPGESQQSGWIFTAGIPFAGTVIYRYQVAAGPAQFAAVSFTCGPTVGPGTAPPVITTLTVEPVAGDLEPGDTLKVDYGISSNVGLWETFVTLSGPCQVTQPIIDSLRQSVTQTILLVIPAACQLGVPISLTVTAVDAALQQTSRHVATQLSLVDKTPPHVFVMFFGPYGSGTTTLAGEYFTGDSIRMVYMAGDNHELRALVWEVWPAGYRDSLIVSGSAAAPGLAIPLRPEWSGPLQLKLYAHDAQGLTSDTIVTSPDSVHVYPSIGRPTAWTSVDGEIRDFVIDQRRGVVYLMQSNQARIAVFSITSMTITTTLPMPFAPSGIDLTDGGDSLVVALPGPRALGIIDLREPSLPLTLLPLTALDTAIGQRPARVRTTAAGKALVPLEGSVPSAYTLLEVDLSNGAQTRRVDAGDGGNTGGGLLESSLDRRVLVLNGGPGLFQSYDAIADSFGPRRSASVYDWPPAVDATGQHVAIGFDLYDVGLVFLRRAHTFALPNTISYTALSPDGQYLYQSLIYGILRSRVSDGALLDRSLSPIIPGQLRVSPDGTLLVIVNSHYSATSMIATMDLR